MYRLIMIFLLTPALLFAQEKSKKETLTGKKFPVHSIRTNLFKVKSLSLNKLVPFTEGEVLQTEIYLESNVDDPMELYIFTIATFENDYITKSSFESPSLDDKKRIKLIAPFPYDLNNFKYSKGQFGEKKDSYIKYPKNIKAGINPETKKPYVLKDKLMFRSRHITKYIKKFNFFNELTILIFDKNEKLIYRQLYKLKKFKR